MAHIENDKSYLLFIEPKERPIGPIIDEYTRKITGAIRQATRGCSTYAHRIPASFYPGGNFRGLHICECGAASSNMDYLLSTTDKSLVKINQNNFESFMQGSPGVK